MKRVLILTALSVLIISTMALSFADATFRPSEILANLLGKSTEDVYELRLESGKTFGQLAEENGVYSEFSEATLEAKKARLSELVEEGKLTQEEADQMLENFEACDGTQSGLGRGLFGKGSGGQGCNGQGLGQGQGKGNGMGGRGMMKNW